MDSSSVDRPVPERPPSPSEKFSSLFWRKKHATVTYCCVFWSFGMCVAFLGPTLLDLGCKTGASFATMGWVFFAQTLFILVGSATGGFLAQRLSGHLVLFVSTIVLASTMAVIPLCNAVGLLALVLAIMGYFMGTIDTVANVAMIRLYTKDVSPFLQALHFFYGLGAFVSPMIAEPFLVAKNCSGSIGTHHATMLNATRAMIPVAPRPSPRPIRDDDEGPVDETRINYAFWIMALLQVPVIVLVFTLFAKTVYKNSKNSDAGSSRPREEYEVMDKGLKLDFDGPEDVEPEDRPQATPAQAMLLTLLTAILLFLYDGLQAAYGGYIYSYAVKSIANLETTEAAYLNACFWGTFAFGRLISIAIATKVSPDFMLFCNIIGCIISMILMLMFHHDHITLYLGTSMFGVFLSSVYPTAISLAEQYINVTSTLASCIIVGAATGEMLLPIIVGHEFDQVGPISLLVTGVIITILSIFVYVAIWITGNSILRRTATPGMLGMLTSFLPKGSSDEDSGLVTHHVKYYSRMRSDMSESSLGGDNLSDGGATTELTNDKQ